MIRIINKKGFTLIELIIATSIMVIILGLIMTIYLTSFNLYQKTVNQSINQTDIRIASDFISRELRSASDISTNQMKIQAKSNKYYALTLINNTLVKQTIIGATVDSSTNVGGQITQLTFSKSDNQGVLKINIICNMNGQNYNSVFEILLNNISGVIIPSSGSETNIIYYITH